MTKPRFASAGIVATVWALAGCSSEQQVADGCVPGQSIECSSTNGCTGVQRCNADGSGYEPCNCNVGAGGVGLVASGGQASSNPLGAHSGGATTDRSTTGTGSASSAMGGRSEGTVSASGATTNTTSSAGGATSVGGATSNAAGGTGQTANGSCEPSSMNGYAYPSYVAARQLQGSCSEQAIRQYYADCVMNDNCSAYAPGGSESQCGACLSPTDLDSKSYGPLLKVGTTFYYFYEANVAGCQELVGETNCAPRIQTKFSCKHRACAENCPIVDFASLDSLLQCMSDAELRACQAETSAANCLTDANHYYDCWGAGFQSQFLAVARVFCL